ncbi:MAG: hypothetical protein R3190_09300 [Thermoanaerobaculia bacterium]|nr:hypothetical protein [Thermoanaerobaculia bacterium]
MTQDRTKLLRYALRADAVFCALAAVDALLFSERIAELLGIAEPRIVSALGVGLLAWAVHLVVASRRDTLSLKEAWYFVGGGLLWIVGSVGLILAGPFSTQGNWLVGLVAVAVLAFTEAQYLGIRRLRDETPTLVRHAA